MFRTKKDVERHVSDVLSKIQSENEKNLRGYTFARLFFQVKDYDAAKKYLSGFLSIRDHHAPAHKLMAQIYEATNNPENALQSYKRSLEIDSQQTDIVLKICELYCQLSVDHETARYWADRAEQLFPHNEIVFKLRECLVSADGEPNHQELENLIATELEAQPRNIGLRVRLLRLYLDTERVKEAYDHATMIESKRLFLHSVEWYYLLGDIFEAYQEEFSANLDPSFYMNYMSALDRLILLTLAEPHAFSCENGTKQYSINDAAAVLLIFDQLLKKACSQKITESSWTYFIHHMKGQLYFYMTTLLLKRAKMDQGNRKEALRFSAGLAVVCYSFKPINLLQEIWFSNLEDNQKAFTNYFQQGCLRTSFIGHVIMNICKEDKSKWLQKLKLDVCINQVKERIYGRAFSSVIQKDQLLSSYFIKDSTFENCSLEFPSETALQEYDKAAYKLCPDSLHHLVWLELHRQTLNGLKFDDSLPEVFKGLQYSNKNLSKGSCESLCILDLEAYLWATVYQAQCTIEKKKSFPNAKIQDSQLSYPPDIADTMCSNQQASWWKAAYGLHACTIKDKLGESRRVLSHGLEVIRGVGNHGMEVQLIVHLARMFAEKADYLLKEQGSSDNKKLKPDNVTALQQRAIHYWNIALNSLEKMSSGQTARIPKEQMFIGLGKTLSKDEIKTLQDDGQLYIAVNLMDSEKLDEAAEVLSKLATPYGSYYLALTLKRMASLEEKFSNTKSVLLTKAKNSIHETMDRIKDDKKHPLNKEIYLVLGDIEAELGTYRSLNNSQDIEESDETDAFCDSPETNNSVYITPNSHKSIIHSTPRPSLQFMTTKSKIQFSDQNSHKHFEPSPERLDAQIRALSLNQDTMLKTLLDQQKTFTETTSTFTDTLKQNTEVLDQLKKLLEELKVSDIKCQARGSGSKHAYVKGQGDEEDYSEYDPNNLLEFYAEDNEDYRNPTYSYNPSSRMVHEAAAASLNYVMPPAIPPGPPPPLNHYNYQYPPHAVLPPPPPVEQRPSFYHPPPGQGLPFSEGQQLPQFQFHVATPVVKPPPPVITSMGSIPQPVQLPPTGVNLQPSQPAIPSPNTPMSMTNPWTKTVPHAFQISLPSSAPFGSTAGMTPAASQSELKNLLKMPPPVITSPFNRALSLTPNTMAPVLSNMSIFAGISKTPTETTKLDRSRCDSESAASLDNTDGDLEREVMGDFKPLIPLPAEIVVETGEENEVVLFEDRAKLYRFVDQEWKERGIGIVKILHHNASGRVRLLMRRDQVLKVCANHYMSSNMEISPLKSSDRAWTWVAQDFADEVLRPEHFCIRFKTAELAASFKLAFDKAINIVKETESKKGASPRAPVKDSSSVVQKGFGSQFMPKAGSWSCPACYINNSADKLLCAACETKKPSSLAAPSTISSTSISSTTASPKPLNVTSPIVSNKTTSNENQFGMSTPVSFQTSKFGSNSNIVSSSATQNVFGGFTFSSSPTIREAEEPDREILVVSTKSKNGPQVSKVHSSPFSGFSFGKSPTSGLTVQLSDNSRNVSVTSEKSTPFSGLSPFASSATTFSTNIQSSTTNTTNSSESSLSKLQSMVQSVKPGFETKDSTKISTVSFSNESQKSSTTNFFGTPLNSQTSLNTNKIDGSPEEFVPTAEFKPVVPLPALVDVKTGEEEEEKLFEERAKLFRFDSSSKEWKERGTGELKILYLKQSQKYRILMRRDQVLKICANHYIIPEMKLTPLSTSDKSWVWFAQDFSGEDLVQEQFAARFKTSDIAKKFESVFLKCQAQLREAASLEPANSNASVENKCTGNSSAFEQLLEVATNSWVCSHCKKSNLNNSSCIYCQTPKLSNKESTTEHHKEEQKPLSELFKPEAGTWECDACYVRNRSSDIKCVSCYTSKPSSAQLQQETSKPSDSTITSSTKSFGDAFKPQPGSWECQSCLVRNSADKIKCLSCETDKSGSSTKNTSNFFGITGFSSSNTQNAFSTFQFGSSNTSTKPAFSFGTSNTKSATEPQTDKQKPLSELFKPDVGTWECDACYVRNKSDDIKCVSCYASKPGSSQLQQETSRPSDPTVTSSVNQTKSFGDAFKPQPGSWECQSCLVRNSADKTKCVSCETDKSGISTKSSSVFGSSGFSSSNTPNAFGTFQFSSSNTSTKPTFSFGNKSAGEFVFGMRPTSQPTTFSFGHSTLSNKENETADTCSSNTVFGGMSQKIFGGNSNTSEPNSMFGGSATKFNFASLAESQESKSDSEGFKFGSPQKYEFNFPGVRPRSPVKTPKSPRSPATPSDADEDDEDSDVDNIYFQPAIPLPPKVEVKTGEEDEKSVFCNRAKLYRFSNGEWKERGIGDIKILLDEKTNRVRLLMRREQVLKVCLNHHLTKDITFERRNDKSWSWAATDFSENEPSPELLAIKFKTGELADEFKRKIDETLKRSSFPVSPPKSESGVLKPASTTFSFKTNLSDERKTDSDEKSLDTKCVFGSAATGFSFKTEEPRSFTALNDASPRSFFTKPTFGASSIFGGSSVFGDLGVKPLDMQKDDDIEVLYEAAATPEKIALAQKLQLPKNFFLYERKKPCPGCIGCTDTIPPYKVDEPEEPVTEPSLPSTNVSQEPTSEAQEASAPFLSSKFNTFSFSQIASDSSFQGLTKSSPTGKNVFAGAGTPLFQNLNTSADDGGDEVAQGPDIHFEPVIPLPDLIEVKTGEEDETPLFVFRAKLFRFDPNVKQWKERGIGDIKILSHKEKLRFRIIMRRDQVHNVACNHCITEDMHLSPLTTSENALFWTALDFSDGQGEATQFAVRFKHIEQTNEFKQVFLDCQEKLRSSKKDLAQVNETTSGLSNQTTSEVVSTTVSSESSGNVVANPSETAEGSDEYSDDDDADELLFEKRTTLEVFNETENAFKPEGMGTLKIFYDDSIFGYRVQMEGDDGKILCDHLIAVQTCLRTEGKSATWAAIDLAAEPAKRRNFRVKFSSAAAIEEFRKIFVDGKEIAIKSPIVENSE